MKQLECLLVFISAIFIFFSGCEETIIPPNPEPETIFQYVLGDSTTIPSSSASLVITTIDSNKITLSYSTTPPNYKVGFIIMDTVSQGYCRKIQGVSGQGNTVVLNTTHYPIANAFKEFRYKRTLRFNQQTLSYLKSGKRHIDTNYNRNFNGKDLKVRITGDKKIEYGDFMLDNKSFDIHIILTNIQIEANIGSVTYGWIKFDTINIYITPSLEWDLQTEWGVPPIVKYLKCIGVLDAQIDWNRSTQLFVSFSGNPFELHLFDIVGPTIAGFILTGEIVGGWELDITVSNPIITNHHGTGNASIRGGFEIFNNNFSNPSFTFDLNGSINEQMINNNVGNYSVSTTVSPFLRFGIGAYFLGIVGPQFSYIYKWPFTISSPPLSCNIKEEEHFRVSLKTTPIVPLPFEITADRLLRSTTISTNCGYGQSGWYQLNSGTSNNLRSVYFVNSITGFTAGDNILLKTTNSGNTWIQVINEIRGFLGLCFPNSNTGYISDINQCQTLKTTNVGSNWFFISYVQGLPVISFYFLNTLTGYAAGGTNTSGGIAKTINGGYDWTTLIGTHPVEYPTFHSIFFNNINTGYVTAYGNILKTTNAGINWINQISGTSYDCNSIIFTDDNIGFAVGYNGVILKTNNAGSTWNLQSSGTNNELNSVVFPNSNIGYIAGNNILLKTSNGGGSWINQLSGHDFKSIFFINEYIGYAVGNDGVIFKTTTGGK